mmetsp:Transcript_8269/g.22045  ORF Transcript_8269/g.22045 Transcript_8269/m.22045 type:complete len:325 (+) Transcript_8269:417-1391(+)
MVGLGGGLGVLGRRGGLGRPPGLRRLRDPPWATRDGLAARGERARRWRLLLLRLHRHPVDVGEAGQQAVELGGVPALQRPPELAEAHHVDAARPRRPVLHFPARAVAGADPLLGLELPPEHGLPLVALVLLEDHPHLDERDEHAAQLLDGHAVAAVQVEHLEQERDLLVPVELGAGQHQRRDQLTDVDPAAVPGVGAVEDAQHERGLVLLQSRGVLRAAPVPWLGADTAFDDLRVLRPGDAEVAHLRLRHEGHLPPELPDEPHRELLLQALGAAARGLLVRLRQAPEEDLDVLVDARLLGGGSVDDVAELPDGPLHELVLQLLE